MTREFTAGAPVQFEGNASRITGFQCRHWDNNQDHDLVYRASLRRHPTGGTAVQDLSTIDGESSGALANAIFKTTASSIAPNSIQLNDNAFSILLEYSATSVVNMRFYGCRVAYEVDEP